MSWGVDEKGEPRGVSPTQTTGRHLQSRLGTPWGSRPGKTPRRRPPMGRAPRACRCPGQPPGRGWGFKEAPDPPQDGI